VLDERSVRSRLWPSWGKLRSFSVTGRALEPKDEARKKAESIEQICYRWRDRHFQMRPAGARGYLAPPEASRVVPAGAILTS
jgi:hypothetical protein